MSVSHFKLHIWRQMTYKMAAMRDGSHVVILRTITFTVLIRYFSIFTKLATFSHSHIDTRYIWP
jgi:hypothetical protein